MKKAGVVARFAFAAALLTCACAPAPPRQTLRMVYPHELVTLDPHAHRDLVTRTVLSAVYEGLVRFDPGVPVRPWLADRWTNPDQRTWWIHIREGVLFHDGRLVTPADVVASIERARSNPALGGELEDIEIVRELASQPGMVEVKTTAPSPLLLAYLQMMAVVPRDFDPSQPVGTGPYRWQMGSPQGPLLLERWDRYWGEAPDFDQVSIQFVPVLEELASLLHQGRVDCVASVTVSYVAGHRPEAGWRVVSNPGGSTTYLVLNVAHPPFDDLRVRAAVDQAIDRHAIVERVFPRGTVEPARSLVPPEVFGYGGEPAALPPAEDAATPIAAPRGADGSPLFLDYSNRYPPFVDFLVQALDGVGLQVEPRSLPYEDLYHRIETGGSRIYVFSWHFLVADALPFLNALIHSRDPLTGMGRFNGADFSDPEVDAEIVAAAREPLSEVRLDHLRQALARTSEAHVYLPLLRPQALALVRNSLTIEPVPGPLARPQDVHLVK